MATTGPETSLHRLQRRRFGRHSLLDVAFDALDHDYGVVHHQADRQHQAEERQRVDGEAEHREKSEGAHQRNRHRQQRNERRPPALQEHEDHQRDQRQRGQEGEHDFAHAFGDGLRCVQRNVVINVGGKALLQFGQSPLDLLGGIQCVGAGQLIHGHVGGGLAFVAANHVVILAAQFDAGDVFEPHHRAIRVGAHDDLAELLRRHQPALGHHVEGELLSRRRRVAAQTAGGVDGILTVHRADNFRHGDVQLGQQVGFDPDPHGILSRAEHIDLGDAFHPAQFIIHVDVGIIGQKLRVVRPLGGKHRDKQKRRRSRFLHQHAQIAHVGRQLAFRLRIA